MTAAPVRDKDALEKFLREGGPQKLEYVKRYELRSPLSMMLQKSAAAQIKIEPDAFRTVLDTNGREKAVLTLDDVEVPPKQDVFVRVFVNKPDASAGTSIDDPHYAGSFAFFCCEKDGGMKGHEMPPPSTPSATPTATAATPTAPSATPTATGAAPASNLPKRRYLVDVTPTIRKLSSGGSLSADLNVTLVTVPVEEQRKIETQQVNLGRLELAVARF